jgi:hypothetical protein
VLYNTHEIFTFHTNEDPSSRGGWMVWDPLHTHPNAEKKHFSEPEPQSTLKYIKKHFTISINKRATYFDVERAINFWVSTTRTTTAKIYILYAWFRKGHKLIEGFSFSPGFEDFLFLFLGVFFGKGLICLGKFLGWFRRLK